MASITISGGNIVSYYSGTAHSAIAFMGTTFDGNYNLTCVCRYAFTTDGYGATGLSFRTANATAVVQGVSTSEDSIGRMRFAVTADGEEYKTYKGNNGSAITDYAYGQYVAGSLSVKLLPNTTYYLWIFPAANFAGFTRFNLGSCTLTTTGSYGTASAVTAANGSFGSAVPITLTNSVSGVSHTVTIRCGGATETFTNVAGSMSWTPALATYGPRIPNARTASAVITCETFYGGVSWGSSSKTVTLSFPGSVGVSISSVAIACDNSGTAASAFSLFVQGYSRARATISTNSAASSAGNRYGATISRYELSIGGAAVSGASNVLTSAAVSASGSVTATVKVTDSRGFTATKTASFTVSAYAKPKLSAVSVFRCGASGTAADDGTWLSARATANYSALGGGNSVSMTVAYKAAGAASYGTENAMSSGTVKLLSPLNADTTYTARIRCTDSLGNTASYTVGIPSRKWAMKFNSTGTAVGFGMAPQAANRLEIPGETGTTGAWNIVRGTEQALFQTAARN